MALVDSELDVARYRGGPTRSWIKVKIRREGRFVLGGVVGLPHTFAGILVGQRIGRRLLYRGTVEWGPGCEPLKIFCAVAANAARRPSMTSTCRAA